MSGGILGRQLASRQVRSSDIANGVVNGPNMASGVVDTVTTFTSGTSSLTIATLGLVLVNAAGGNVILNLPAASIQTSPPLTYRFVRTDTTSANSVTINRAGSDTIDGATSIALGIGSPFSLESDTVSIWKSVSKTYVRGSVLLNTTNTMTIGTTGITQFNPAGGWTNVYDTTPTSVSGNTLVVPANMGITRVIINAALPMNSGPAAGIAFSIRKNSAIIAGSAGYNGTPSGGNMSTQALCTGGDIFDLAFITATGTGTLNNATSLYGSAFISATWM